jgi:hypothetical protein
MMTVSDNEATMAVEETGSPLSSIRNTNDANNVGSSDTAEAHVEKERSDHGMADDQYPHGLKLALLAGASIVAVFLIALDQVSTLTCPLTEYL